MEWLAHEPSQFRAGLTAFLDRFRERGFAPELRDPELRAGSSTSARRWYA